MLSSGGSPEQSPPPLQHEPLQSQPRTSPQQVSHPPEPALLPSTSAAASLEGLDLDRADPQASGLRIGAAAPPPTSAGTSLSSSPAYYRTASSQHPPQEAYPNFPPPPQLPSYALSSSPADLSSGGSSYRIPAAASSYPIAGIPSDSLCAVMPPNMYHHAGSGGARQPNPSATAASASYYTATGAAAAVGGGGIGIGGGLRTFPPAPSNTSSNSNTPLGTSPSLLHQQVQQMQHQLQQQMSVGGLYGSSSDATGGLAPPQPPRTPWTLGSTDGLLAYQLAVLEQERQQQEQDDRDAAVGAGGVAIRSTPTQQHAGALTTEMANSAAVTSLGIGDQSSTGSPSAAVASHLRHQYLGGGGGGASVSTASTPPYPSSANVLSSGASHTPPHSTAATLAAPAPTPYMSVEDRLALLTAKQSLYQDRLFQQASASVESVLAASCEVVGFDIAEMWLRTGPKTHQLTNSHLRPTALEDSVRQGLVDVYYGEKSSERTHRLSPALCKRAKEAGDVVWVTAHTQQGAEALRCSISNVRTAVAIPVCHELSNTNVTVIFFSIRRIIVRPTSVEFLVHMALAAGVASVNSLSEDGLLDRGGAGAGWSLPNGAGTPANYQSGRGAPSPAAPGALLSQSEHVFGGGLASSDAPLHVRASATSSQGSLGSLRHRRADRVSVTGAQLDLQWRQLRNVEYLTDGGNSWIHTAVYNGRPVVVKTLKPECQDVALAINEIEGELAVHARLHHPNIVELLGAGTTSKGVRFVVLERLDGGTLTQRLGYDTRIRDRRRRFWRKKHFSYLDVLRIARSIAQAMAYCHEDAIPGCVALHRDLKPDNIGFTLDGTVKILDFGLAKIVENATVSSDEVYQMSGETGSLRYMAPEVADALPYNHCADVYSFGIILWELNAGKKPFDGLNRELFYERVVHGGERPPLHRKWPKELTSLMSECWDADMHHRPRFRDVVDRLDRMLNHEKGGTDAKKKALLPKLSGMIDRHSTWF